MKLTKEQIKHTANLARLELTKQEIEKYAEQMSDILNYIDQLKKVATSNIQAFTTASSLTNVFREDEIKEWNQEEIDLALQQAHVLEDNQYKVKKTI